MKHFFADPNLGLTGLLFFFAFFARLQSGPTDQVEKRNTKNMGISLSTITERRQKNERR